MLPTDNEYDIYFAGAPSKPRTRTVRRQSWPKTATPTAAARPTPTRFSPRRVVGRALIGLGQFIASEPRVAAEQRVATSAR